MRRSYNKSVSLFCMVVMLCALPISDACAELGPVTTEAEALALLNLDYPGMESVKIAAASGDMAEVKKAYLDFRRTKSTAHMANDVVLHPAAGNDTDEIAEEICRHHIRNKYKGLQPRSADMGRDFNWKYNPIPKNSSSYTLEWTWCAVSRTHFWNNLTEGYSKTGNEKYAQEWVTQLFDFAAKNPANEKIAPGEASLWRTLDAALRIRDTWSPSYFRCMYSSAFTPDAQWMYLRLMNDHGRLLSNGLTPTRTGNWVTTECSALYTLGVLFPELKDAPNWRKMAIDRLQLEAERIVPPDGFEAELSPGYHIATLYGFMQPMQIARKNGLTLPESFSEKLLAMYQANILIMDQKGRMPAINDSHNVDAVAEAKRGVELLGNDPLLLWAATGGQSGKQPPASVVLPYAGFYVMRSGWHPDDTYLFFRAGPTGIAHYHEDMLQIILAAGGKTLLFDPGNYTYDHSDWRRYALNSVSHNTVMVDGKWQHRGRSNLPITEPVHNPWITTPLADYVSATYDKGYQLNEYDDKQQYYPQKWIGDVDKSVRHTRHVLFIKPQYVLVLDFLDGRGTHVFDALFHMNAPAAILDDKSQSVTSQNSDGMQLTLYPFETDTLKTDIIQGQKEPLLGWDPGGTDKGHRPIPTVRFRKQQSAPARFATFLAPHKSAMLAIQASPVKLNSSQLLGYNVSLPDENIIIRLATDQNARELSVDGLPDPLHSTASGLIYRQSAAKSMCTLTLWGATRLNAGPFDLSFRSSAPVSFTAVKKDLILYVYQIGADQLELQCGKSSHNGTILPSYQWMTLSANGKLTPVDRNPEI